MLALRLLLTDVFTHGDCYTDWWLSTHVNSNGFRGYFCFRVIFPGL